MKYSLVIISIGVIIFVMQACGHQQKTDVVVGKDSVVAKAKDTSESCVKPITDPNNPKPMALMMRQMAANADSMKQRIERGEKVDGKAYPFVRFYMAEPTDPTVLEPRFFENARLFQQSYLALFEHSNEQAKYHNLVIQKCINCHESYCSGPLKRIRKLLIPIPN